MPLFRRILILTVLSFSAANASEYSFALPRLEDKEIVHLNEFKGKMVYVDFWASWCGPCLKSLPLYEEVYGKYKDRGFEIIAINLDRNQQDASNFLQQKPISYISVYGWGSDVAENFKVMGMPSSYLFDRNGHLIMSHKGFKLADIEKLEHYIEEAL